MLYLEKHVDIHMDKNFGTSDNTFKDDKNVIHNPLTFRTSMKYALIFQISCNLPVELKQMKTYLVKTSSKLIDKPTTSVRDWTETLTTEFESKGILHYYTNANKDIEIWKDPEIQDACKSQGKKACRCCAVLRCRILQRY